MNKYIEAYDEMRDELKNVSIRPIRPTVEEMMQELGPIPMEGLVIGMANDGFPVLMNLKDPRPRNVLVISDHGHGKTNFLRSVASMISYTHKPEEVQYAVITGGVSEWDVGENCIGMFNPNSRAAEDLILSMALWAHNRGSGRQSVILLFDNLIELTKMDLDAVQNFRWLMNSGAQRGVWVFASIDSSDVGRLDMASGFKTRVFGRVTDEYCLRWDDLKYSQVESLSEEYTISQDGKWLKFFTPEV